MSFRVPAAVAAVAVLGLGEWAPAGAQPQAPVRPRYNSFGNLFSPRPALGVQGAAAGNLPFMNPIGPQVAGVPGGQGFVVPGQGLGYPGQLNYYGQTLPGVFAVDPNLPPTGVVGTFNNLGHWYSSGTGGPNLGHWYPNGVASGSGVLGYGGGAGGGYGPRVGGGIGAAGLTRPGGTALGTALGVGAVANTFRK